MIGQNKILENKLPIYVAKRYDHIDQALGQFLNEYPERDKIRIMFLRESEGVYQFGSKRVYIKVENGDQPYMRVGGGFMHARDFISIYTDGEVDKIDRKNVLNIMEEKAAVQRIAAHLSNRSVERRPIRDRSTS